MKYVSQASGMKVMFWLLSAEVCLHTRGDLVPVDVEVAVESGRDDAR